MTVVRAEDFETQWTRVWWHLTLALYGVDRPEGCGAWCVDDNPGWWAL